MINQIHNQDCIEFMKTLPNEFIDLTVTDPPYLINYSSFRTNSKVLKTMIIIYGSNHSSKNYPEL
jgi:DNA modification methylase